MLYLFTSFSLGLPTVNDARSIQQSTILTEGIAANLTCVATGLPQSNITWQYNSAIISANSSNVYEGSPLITTTSVLTINYPTRSMDGQQITCFILHQFSSTMNRTTTLSIDCELFYFPVDFCGCTSSVHSEISPLRLLFLDQFYFPFFECLMLVFNCKSLISDSDSLNGI